MSFVHSAWGMLGLVVLTSLVMLWPSWMLLSSIWLNWSDFSHGYLIAIICVGLIFRQRGYLRTSRCDPWGWGVLLLLVFGFVWLVARLALVETVELLLLPAMVWTLCLTTLGWKIARKLLFPVFFLIFAIPVWDSGNHILQQFTVVAVEYMINKIGLPAFIQGNFVYLATGTFEIAAGCSGLHYFIAAVTIAALYGYLDFEKSKDRIILLLTFALVAMIGNWIRVFVVIYAGYATNMQHYLVRVDHYYFGWLLFVLFLIPVFIVSRRFQSSHANNINSSLDAGITDTASVRINAASIKLLILAAVYMAVLTIFSSINLKSTEAMDTFVEAPAGNPEWVISERSEQDWRPLFLGAKHELMKDYSNDGNVINLYMNLYTDESRGKEMVGFNNRIEGSDGWKIDKSSIITLEPVDGVEWKARILTLRSETNHYRVVYYWYEISGYRTAADFNAKVLQGISRLSGEATAGIVALSTKCAQANCDTAHLNLNNWLKEIWLEGSRIKGVN